MKKIRHSNKANINNNSNAHLETRQEPRLEIASAKGQKLATFFWFSFILFLYTWLLQFRGGDALFAWYNIKMYVLLQLFVQM
jgi:hypothetical protein